MCQRGHRGEKTSNEGLLLRFLLAILFAFTTQSFYPSCQARLLLPALEPGHDDGYGGGRDETLWGEGLSAGGRSLLQNSSAPPAESSNSGSGPGLPLILGLVIGLSAAALLLIIIIVMIRVVFRKRRREDGFHWKKGISDNENEELSRSTYTGVESVSFEELALACEDFTNVIGTSPECVIFKGTRASDGLQIAVTRMQIPNSSWTPSKEIGFRHKVNELARMNHENLVNLLGYCSSEEPFERMLVFEYVSNGTIHEYLHGTRGDCDHLDWAARMKILMGAAYGLQYMHHELDPPSSHFKFDASHVFLTDDFAAKVADFGISAAPVVSNRKSLSKRSSFNKLVRAMGYTDWDGYRQTPYFVESNIKGFGMFMLETISGRSPYSDSQGPLNEWAKEYLVDPEKQRCLVDRSLKSHKKAELAAICEVINLCFQQRASKMPPTMRDVVDIMSKALRMSREKANRKSGPLLWAETQLLSSMERGSEDGGTPRGGTPSPTGATTNFHNFMFNNSNNNSPREQGQEPEFEFPILGESAPPPLSSHESSFREAGSGGPSPRVDGHGHRSTPSDASSHETTINIHSPRQGGSTWGGLHRPWPDSLTELQLRSPGYQSGVDEETPLAGPSSRRKSSDMSPISDYISAREGSRRESRRSFRKARLDNSSELAILDDTSKRRSKANSNSSVDSLGR